LERKTASLSEQVSDTYREAFAILIENPTISFLFLLIAFLDVGALMSLFLAHSWPFSAILAPIIRTFWDDRFLHYPQNFVLLPKLYNHAHFVILSVFGVIVNGIVVKKIEGAVKGNKVHTSAAAVPVLKKYLGLLIGWLVSYGVFVFAAEKILGLLPGNLPLQIAAGFGVSLILQSLFAFILPSLVLGGRGFLKDFWDGIVFGFQNFIPASLIVALPVLIIVIFSFLKALAPVYTRTYPEAVLWVLLVGVFVSLIVEIMVTVTTTLFYIKVRNRQW
jgi:hypothetical protein